MGRDFHMPHAFRAVQKKRTPNARSSDFELNLPNSHINADSTPSRTNSTASFTTELSIETAPNFPHTQSISPPTASCPHFNQTHSLRAPSLANLDAESHYASSINSGMDIQSIRKTSAASINTTGIDGYGFKKPTFPEYDQWNLQYQQYLQTRLVKWTRLLETHGLAVQPGQVPVRFPPDSQRLRRYVRKGIPPAWRGNAWFWYAKGHDKLKAHPDLYSNLVKQSANLNTSDTEHIERDLHRTFPDNIYFRNSGNEESMHLKALRRVLTAFSVYQPKIGYCQSLNFIAGNLLLFMDEEKAFWMLVIITQQHLPGLHEINLEQVNISQGILMISVRDRLPKIWSALNLEQSFEENFISSLPPVSLCTAPWFMSLMVNVLPTETMMRVWDCFFVEGPKTLFRISLAIFKLMEPQLLKASDELEVFQTIQAAPGKLYDPEVLLKACYKRQNGFGHLSNEDIQLLKQFVQSRRKTNVEQSSDRKEYAKLHRGRRIKARLNLYR